MQIRKVKTQIISDAAKKNPMRKKSDDQVAKRILELILLFVFGYAFVEYLAPIIQFPYNYLIDLIFLAIFAYAGYKLITQLFSE
jgi:hypothetical protein